jgi:hypothetical protein
MLRLLFLAALIPILSACATPYAQEGFTGGFEVKDLGQDVYRVRFQGNGYTSKETVQTYWLYRCAELALEQGFTGFEILSDMQFVMRPARDDPSRMRSRLATAPMRVGTAGSRSELADAQIWRSDRRGGSAEGFGERVMVARVGPVLVYSGGGAPHPMIEGDVHFLRKPVESTPPKLFNAKALHAALEPIITGEKCGTGNVCPHVHEYLLPKGKLK